MTACWWCGGHGRVVLQDGAVRVTVTCSRCYGSGVEPDTTGTASPVYWQWPTNSEEAK